MTDIDAEALTEGLHTNLTAIAVAVDAIDADQVENSPEMKALGAKLSGRPEAAKQHLKEGDDGGSDKEIHELFAESFELTLEIAAALDVPEEDLMDDPGGESTSGLDTVARALGGR